MKFIQPTFEIVTQGHTLKEIKEHIEKCARVCYKSEHLIKEGSAEPFIDRLIKKEHTATLEHGTIYLTVSVEEENFDGIVYSYRRNKYSEIRYNDDLNDGTAYITTNYRVIIQNNWEEDLKFLTTPTKYHAKRITVKFNSSIHFYKDFTRHRPMSYCIESTRYCNYFKEKFGKSIKFTIPCWLKEEDSEQFDRDCQKIEDIYFSWIERGWKAEEAAYFLIQGVDADVYITGFVDDWKYIFSLRAVPYAHQVLQELMCPLQEQFYKLGYIK